MNVGVDVHETDGNTIVRKGGQPAPVVVNVHVHVQANETDANETAGRARGPAPTS